MSEMLAVEDVHKHYGDAVALAGVSFAVAEGELFGLLGPNGAGKSTLLSILAGLTWPTAGRASLLGRTVTPDTRDVRRLVGVVPQDLAVYGDLTARENLAFFGTLYGLRGEELARRADDVLRAVGLFDRAGDRTATFSGGMKRRLNLAVALVHRPKILFLDEPTVGVDPQSRNAIFEQVRRLNADGTTVIYTSHYMEEVQALCRRVGILDAGRLIACGELPALLRTLDAVVRFRPAPPAPGLADRLAALGALRNGDGVTVELHTTDVPATLQRLFAVLNELHVRADDLEVQEPNLERVFLHLTGRALRD
jgi:ABC-2 type transport system ATP-binding protein